MHGSCHIFQSGRIDQQHIDFCIEVSDLCTHYNVYPLDECSVHYLCFEIYSQSHIYENRSCFCIAALRERMKSMLIAHIFRWWGEFRLGWSLYQRNIYVDVLSVIIRSITFIGFYTHTTGMSERVSEWDRESWNFGVKGFWGVCVIVVVVWVKVQLTKYTVIDVIISADTLKICVDVFQSEYRDRTVQWMRIHLNEMTKSSSNSAWNLFVLGFKNRKQFK